MKSNFISESIYGYLSHLEPFLRDINYIGGTTYIAGGAARDLIYNSFEPKTPRIIRDIDIEIFGLHIQHISNLLDSHDIKYITVGKEFGVITLPYFDLTIDISLPRRENRIGVKHTDFEIQFDPEITTYEASLRRDFTMNAIMIDILKGTIIDHFNGMNDIQDNILHHVNEDTFVEDSLRVLRGMQFIARFDLKPSNKLINLCKSMSFKHISKERIYFEFDKLIYQGKNIYAGLQFLKDINQLEENFPELHRLIDCPQDPIWHPEGDVFTHTGYVMNEFAKIRDNNEFDYNKSIVIGFGCLCHDMGKPDTTKISSKSGRYTAKGHAYAGVEISERFLRRITNNNDLISQVKCLVKDHMVVSSSQGQLSDKAIKKLARRVNIEHLSHVISADISGRPPLIPDFTEVNRLTERAKQLEILNEGPSPIVMGRHLIEIGIVPSKQMGVILARCTEAEDAGLYDNLEDGLKYVKDNILPHLNIC